MGKRWALLCFVLSLFLLLSFCLSLVVVLLPFFERIFDRMEHLLFDFHRGLESLLLSLVFLMGKSIRFFSLFTH